MSDDEENAGLKFILSRVGIECAGIELNDNRFFATRISYSLSGVINAVLMESQSDHARFLVSVKADFSFNVFIKEFRGALGKNIQVGLARKLSLQMISSATHIKKEFRRKLIPANAPIQQARL